MKNEYCLLLAFFNMVTLGQGVQSTVEETIANDNKPIIIEDPVLNRYLFDTYDSRPKDGVITRREGIYIKSISIKAKSGDNDYVESLSGIEYLRNLEKLVVVGQRMRHVDLSMNDKLSVVNLSYTDNLDSLILPDGVKNINLESCGRLSEIKLPRNTEELLAGGCLKLEIDGLSSSNIKTLDLSNTGMSVFPNIPQTVRSFWFKNNKIREIPYLPNLELLDVSYNSYLSQVAVLPNTLSIFRAASCQLLVFPSFNSESVLTEIDVNGNRIKYIPSILPSTLNKLNLSGNLLNKNMCELLKELRDNNRFLNIQADIQNGKKFKCDGLR